LTRLRYAILADLLSALEADGNPPGTDLHLSIQELLKKLPDDTPPEALKTLLAPLLCKSKDEQAHFYEIFDKSLKRVLDTGALETAAQAVLGTAAAPPAKKRRRRVRVEWLIPLAMALAGIGWIIWKFGGARRPVQHTFGEYLAVMVDEGAPLQKMRFDSIDGQALLRFENTCPEGLNGSAVTEVDTSRRVLYYAGTRVGADTVCLLLCPVEGPCRYVNRIFIVRPVADSTSEAGLVDTALYTVRPLPHSRDLGGLEPPRATFFQQFLVDFQIPIKAGGIFFSGLFLWWLARRIEQKRRKLIAENQPNAKPPYAWNIRLDGEPEFAWSERYYALLNLLRRREQDEFRRLDVPKTVRATVDKGGIPSFRYTRQTRPAEYLLLIDRQGARNHRSQLFNHLFKTIRTQEILVERFYYDGDPRLCWNESHPQGIGLRDLYYKYPQSRLLVQGNAWHLLNPQTGRLGKWTGQFSAWADRALLTPQPMNDWGRRERTLGELFYLFPTSFSGLHAAVEFFDADDGKDPDLDPRKFADAARETVALQGDDLMATLHHYFGEVAGGGWRVEGGGAPSTRYPPPATLIQWIAACAVYPELHWDLTLFLGQLLSDGDNNLLTAENINQLCRLPWFVEGEIPEAARKTLLGWLEQRHPDVLQRVREGLHRLLSQNPPPQGSAAFDDYSMNVALNEWLMTKDGARKKELERDIAARLASGQAADFTVIKMLDRPRSPLDFVVPDAWKKYVYYKGMTQLGVRSWLWAAPLWLFLSMLLLGFRPKTPACPTAPAADGRGRVYCLQTFEDIALYREILTVEALDKGLLNTADSLTDLTLVFGWQNRHITAGDIPPDVVLKTYEFYYKQNAGRFLDLNSFKTDLQKIDSVYKAANISPQIDAAKPRIDSVSFLQNLATAYFNRGVALRKQEQAGNEANVFVPPGFGSTRNETIRACGYFERAEALNTLLPDSTQLWYVRDAYAACRPQIQIQNNSNDLPPEQQADDFVLRGRVVDAETKRGVSTGARVEAKGLRPVLANAYGNFTLRVPANRQNEALLITVTAEGYQPQTLNARLDGRNLNVGLRPVPEVWVRGQLLDAAEKRPVYLNLLAETRIEVEGLEPFRPGRGAFFSFTSPPNAKNPLKISVESPGYERKEVFINPKEYRNNKSLDIYLIPEKQQAALPTDRDGDGVADAEDKCPDERGDAKNQGCPTVAPEENMRNKLPGYWTAEINEGSEAQKVIVWYEASGNRTIWFYKADNTFLRSSTSPWEVKGNNLTVQSEGRVSAGEITRIDNGSYDISISAGPKGDVLRRTFRRIQPDDRDGDGVLNVVDNCPDEKGTAATSGCPPTENRIIQANGLRVIVAKEGETPELLGKIANVAVNDILFFNESRYDANTALPRNTRIYLERKKETYQSGRVVTVAAKLERKAGREGCKNGEIYITASRSCWSCPEGFKPSQEPFKEESACFQPEATYHFVKNNETMFDIAQEYGIQYYKILYNNNIQQGQEPENGERILLSGVRAVKDRVRIRRAGKN
jgi:LysM domain